MNFSKISNCKPFQKIVLSILSGFIVIGNAIAQQVPTEEQLKGVREREQTPTSTQDEVINNRKNTINRTSTNDTNVRTTTLSVEDAATIQNEEKNRLDREAEYLGNAEKAKTIRRMFGSSIFQNTRFDPTATVNIATPSNYVLGSGDKLNVDIYGYSQFKESVVVNADGFVVLSKAGVVQVSGLSIELAEAKIRAAYSKVFLGLNSFSGYPANTFLKISSTGYRSIKIKITGEVIAPGTYTVTSFTSVINALYASGGPNDIGSYRDIKVIRGNRVVANIDLYDYIIKGYSKGDILLKDQDVILVNPYISRIIIEGLTKRTGLFEMLPHESISEAIGYAGGFGSQAYKDNIKIYRNTATERKIMDVSAAELRSLKAMNGDSVVVEKILDRFENMIQISGAVFRAGSYSVDANPNLSALIRSAGGLKEESMPGRISILRTNDDLSVSNISVNFDAIRDGSVNDIILKRQDQIHIPSLFELTETSFVRIQGAINNPEAIEGVQIPFVKDMTVQDLIVKVGGLTEAASLSKVEVVRRKRNVDPKEIDAQISDIYEFTISPNLNVSQSENFKLLPFDEVFIRSSPNYEKQNFVILRGEVIYPGKYGIKYKDEKISDIINRASGLTPLAFTKGATIIRKTHISEFRSYQRKELLDNLNINTTVKEAKTDTEVTPEEEPIVVGEVDNIITESIGIELNKILEKPGSLQDLILHDGDEIVVPKRLETVRVEGEVLYPTSVKYQPSLKFIDYISKAGGFKKKSAKGRAIVVYPNGSVDRTRKFIFFNLYPSVEPGSEVIVPRKEDTAQDQLKTAATVLATVASGLTTLIGIFGILKLNKNNN